TQLLHRTRTTNLDAYTHQDLPFDYLVEALNPNRSLARHPLFQIMLVLQNVASVDYSGLDITDEEIHNPISRFDMVIEVNERFAEDGSELGLEGFIQYADDLFDQATMEFFVAAWQRLLAAATADPSLPVDRLPVLSDADLHELVVLRNATAHPRGELEVTEAISAQGRSRPEAVAVVTEAGQAGYAEVERRSEAVALLLEERGVRGGEIVAVSVSPRAGLVEAVLGVLKAGAVCLPVPGGEQGGRVAAVLADAMPNLVVCDADAHDTLPAGAPRLLLTEEIMAEASARVKAGTRAVGRRRSGGFSDGAFVIYPADPGRRLRGVMITHRGLANRVECLAGEQQDEAVLRLPGGPVSMDDYANLAATLIRGGTVVLGGEDPAPDPGADLASRQARVARGHGYAETSGICVAVRHSAERPPAPGVPVAGAPLRNTQVYVLDHALRPVPYGVVGELYVAGDGLGLGYVNRPAETAETFVATPFGPPGARMFRTGDLAKWTRQGDLHIVGRAEDQVSIGGVPVNPAEVAAALEGCALVSRAFVVADADAKTGLLAYVVPEEPAAGPSAIRRQASEALPDSLVPRHVVLLEALPLTPDGTVDRTALPAYTATREEARGPVGERERILSGLFAEVLDIPAVGRDDNFFDLGGHSLMAVRLLTRIRSVMGVELPLRDMMMNPSVAGMAEALDGAAKSSRPPLRRMR
ncbi:AMP-binding protein, partial [Nonomuraea sp. B12E4]|uniref:AMP-binding protein n=1 Tax=Nonomuraea sp. B12E4 TaxID=3153564 RepID=UPI00325CF253